ncbi:hypothetical protein TNCV_4004581 [Trichonephila clavipes]|nr:hypothetical protein TNCV_4004581 [Trichonephila clavipes]
MGDFNAKHSSWGCDVDTRRGITFNIHIQRSGYRILAPPTPTSRDLNQLFKERNRARKTWHYTRCPADKNTLNRLQKQIKKIIIKYEQKQWDESLACLEAEDGSLWKAARDSRKKAPPIPALKGPAKIAYSDADKVRTLEASDPVHDDGTRTGTEVITLTQRPIRKLPLATRERKNLLLLHYKNCTYMYLTIILIYFGNNIPETDDSFHSTCDSSVVKALDHSRHVISSSPVPL